MKFDDKCEDILKRYTLNESVLGSALRNIGQTLKAKVYDEPNKMGIFNQGAEINKAKREAQRTKEGAVLVKLQEELEDDPRFINTTITFTDSQWNTNLSRTKSNISSNTSLSARSNDEIINSKPIDRIPYTFKKLNQTSDYRTRAARDIDSYQIEGVKELINNVDLTAYNLFDNNVKRKIKQKCEELVNELNREEKQKMEQDYEGVKTNSDKVIQQLENKINKIFKPLGQSKGNSEEKLKWLYTLVYFSGRNGLEIKR